MNAASISVTKQFGFGLNVLGQSSREKSVRIGQGRHSNWQWHLDEVFVKINSERFYLWRAVDHEGEVRECSRNLPVITPRYTTTSIMKDLFKTDRLISKNAVPLSRSGFKSALHRFV
jgi:hypothetical protein